MLPRGQVLSIPSALAADEGVAEASPDALRVYDEKVDVWATGVLVFELLAGRPPFEVEDPKETAKRILAGEAAKFPVHVSAHARDFVTRALSHSPADRPSADELLQHSWLKHYFGGKVPDLGASGPGGVTAGLLKSWIAASW